MDYYRPSSGLLSTKQWTAIDQAVDYYRPSSGLLSTKQWTTIKRAVDYHQTRETGATSNSRPNTNKGKR
ncbi:hypothetical protein [uncultured Bacteroides sp.]|uniref:hypothetical protein n=1 Tax=uncultured Bacteroides sp. TaxID=162156 RepID=UPI002637B010|nr:hypothetical protein [uncultured Bacteroides sp.]